MWKYAAKIAYVGTDFCGWQKQKGSAELSDKPSVQGTIEKALSRITSEEVIVVGSGRTDSGVHSVGQVAHFVLRTKEWDSGILFRGLNSLLPRSIQALAVQRVPIEFHAQRSTLKKQYSYYFQQGPCFLPHLEQFSWWIRRKLDLEAMQTGLDFLKGEHDFKPFQASGSKPGSTVRTLLEAEVVFHEISFPVGMDKSFFESKEFGLVRVRLVGTGFLKQMVRGISGTLLQVGEGHRPPSCFQEILRTQNRTSVGPTAPARALWQEEIWYPSTMELFT